ncbi:MAG: ASCH domain-containing protein [Microcella sp.]
MGEQLPEIDRAAAEVMWRAYCDAHPNAVAATAEYTVEYFGDSPALADELLGLVLAGTKRATAALVDEFVAEGEALPRIGSHWIACDGTGAPRAVLRSTEFRLATFDEVDARFAFDEGEGDRTLADWRAGHQRYWQRTAEARGAAWSPEQEIVLERFTVVWPPELRDASSAAAHNSL